MFGRNDAGLLNQAFNAVGGVIGGAIVGKDKKSSYMETILTTKVLQDSYYHLYTVNKIPLANQD